MILETPTILRGVGRGCLKEKVTSHMGGGLLFFFLGLMQTGGGGIFVIFRGRHLCMTPYHDVPTMSLAMTHYTYAVLKEFGVKMSIKIGTSFCFS